MTDPSPDVCASGPRAGRPSSVGGLRRTARAAGALLLIAAMSTAACRPQPRVPDGVATAPSPFERLPYLQAVTGDAAVIRWRVRPDSESDVRWRVGSEGWRTASVERLGRGDRRAVLAGLPPGADVDYRVASGATELAPYTFRSPPRDTSSAPVEVLAFGDSGWGGTAQIALARRMRSRSWDLAIHVGDVAYPDGSERDLTLRHFGVYGDLFARVPFYPVPGNHDVRTAGGRPFDRAFERPGDARPGGGGPRRYALRWGRVLFLGLATAPEAARDSLAKRAGGQYRWLEGRLAAAAADSTVGWTVVVTHYPLYSHAAGIAGHGPDEELREALEPLFLEHGVDLVLAGHDHHYERTRPLREGRVVDPGCGPVHMVIGGGGAQRFARSVAPGPLVARIDRSHHFVGLTLHPDAIVGGAVGPDGRVFDRFRILPYEATGRDGECG